MSRESVRNAARRQYIRARLARGCSPEQITGHLRHEYLGDMRKHLSTKTLYGALYMLPRGTPRSELLPALRQVRKTRRPRSRGTDQRGQIPNMTPIPDRPVDIATHTMPDHWEGGLIKETLNGLAERMSRLVILARLEGTNTGSAHNRFTNIKHMSTPLRTALPGDRGKEIAEHGRRTHRLLIRVFFADLDSPWQRGTNENTKWTAAPVSAQRHQLVRHTHHELNTIAHRLNTRPKCFRWATPLKVFAQPRHHSPIALGN